MEMMKMMKMMKMIFSGSLSAVSSEMGDEWRDKK
jgi:hypothetical protein